MHRRDKRHRELLIRRVECCRAEGAAAHLQISGGNLGENRRAAGQAHKLGGQTLRLEMTAFVRHEKRRKRFGRNKTNFHDGLRRNRTDARERDRNSKNQHTVKPQLLPRCGLSFSSRLGSTSQEHSSARALLPRHEPPADSFQAVGESPTEGADHDKGREHILRGKDRPPTKGRRRVLLAPLSAQRRSRAPE